VRFATRLGFAIEPGTAAGIRELAGRIVAISGERIFDELSRMLQTPASPAAARLLAELGLAQAVLPELFDTDPTPWQAGLERLDLVARHQDLVLSLGALLLDAPPPRLIDRLRGWGASNAVLDAILWFAQQRDGWHDAAAWPLARFKNLLHAKESRRLLVLWEAQERRLTAAATATEAAKARAASIAPERIHPPPLLGGEDLKRELRLPEGKALGDLARTLYDAQLNEEVATRDEALALAHRLAGGPK
jgi:poly(A) polymerase